MTTSVIKLINELKSEIAALRAEIAALKAEQSPKIKEKPVKQPSIETILRLPEVFKRIGLKCSSVSTRIKAGLFPRQVKLGGERATSCFESDIVGFMDSLRGAV